MKKSYLVKIVAGVAVLGLIVAALAPLVYMLK